MVNDVIKEEVKTKKKIATHIRMFNFKEINSVIPRRGTFATVAISIEH